MSQSSNDFASMQSIFKESYADKVKDLIPEGVKLLNMINFMSAERQPGNL